MKEKLLIAVTAAVISLSGCAAADAPDDDVLEQLPSEDTGQEETQSVTEMQETDETEDIEEETEEDAEVEIYVDYIIVTGEGVNLRGGAGTNYAVIGSAEKDTLYALIGESGGWYKIRYLGSAAYISKNYSSIYQMKASESEAVESVIEEGAKLLGVPYVYGAVRCHDGRGNLNKNFTADEFDCSSLTQYIFYKGAGVLLDVTTRTQILQGETVDKSDLQRGDLLFFTNASRNNNTGIERVGHVALYLGNNFILHTSSDYAKIERISAQRWSYFLQAQRMVDC